MAHGVLNGVEDAPLQPLSVVEQRHEAERDELVVEELGNELLWVGRYVGLRYWAYSVRCLEAWSTWSLQAQGMGAMAAVVYIRGNLG